MYFFFVTNAETKKKIHLLSGARLLKKLQQFNNTHFCRTTFADLSRRLMISKKNPESLLFKDDFAALYL